MTAKTTRPPLAPADCAHLGRGLDGLEVLRWESQSRDGVRHYTYGTLDAAKDCSCEWRQHHPDTPCKHMSCFVDALRHHLGEPPPPDRAGGVGGPPAPAGLTACEDRDTVELSPEHPGGFWTATAYGPMHVSGDAHMGEETLGALREMAEMAVRQHRDPAPNALDAALADAGGWWTVSRSPGDWPVILTCNNCGATRAWQTETEATRFIREDGACRCDGGGGPTPPAPGAARKPPQDHLDALYGPE